MKTLTEKELMNVNGGMDIPAEVSAEALSHKGPLISESDLESYVNKQVVLEAFDGEYVVGTLRSVEGGRKLSNLWGLFGGAETKIQVNADGVCYNWTYKNNLFNYR